MPPWYGSPSYHERMPTSGIPRPTVRRLSLYLRELDRAAEAGHTAISSSTIARAFGFTDAQVRRFIDDGYLALPVDELGEGFHQTL